MHLRRKLDHTGIAGGCNRSKSRRSENRVRSSQRGCIRQIENLSTDFGRVSFTELNALDESNVDILKARSLNRITRTVADRELRRGNKSIRIKVPARCALPVRQIGIAQAVRPLGTKSGKCIEIGILSYGERHA